MDSKLKTLIALTAGQRLRYAAAIVALAVATFLLYLPPLIVGQSINLLLGDQQHSATWLGRAFDALGGRSALARNLLLAAAAVILATALGGLFTYLKGRWAALASESIAKRLRERLYNHLQHVPAAYHDNAQTGDLVQRCTSDVETVKLFYFSQVTEIARGILLITLVIPFLLAKSLAMTLVAMSLLPLIVGFAILFFKRMADSFKAMDEAEGAMTTTLQENLTGIRVVRAFARQDFEKEKFTTKNATHRDLHWRLYKVMGYYWAASDLLCFAQNGLVLFVGAYFVSTRRINVGDLVAFAMYAQMYIWPVRQIGRIVSELGKALVSVGRIQEILSVPEESTPAPSVGSAVGSASADRLLSPHTPLPERIHGHLSLRNLSFSHGPKQVLHDLTLDIPAGATIALVGPSGSGKSTLMHLLLRLYDYDHGSITLDGMELNTLDRKYVRSQFGVVMQEPFLYSKTLRDNIRLSRHTASNDEVIDSATLAAIHESIMAFDKTYDTLVGERGVTLSGGQRQRVAIARALLRDAPVLILDDALSAVDTHTEAQILAALKRRRGRHTTLLIAHRLSTLMHADRIIVLEHGRITQQGTHDQLITEPGLYQRLWHIQGDLEEDLKRELGVQAAPATPVAALLNPEP